MTAAAPRVLLVDDNPQFRGELRLLLEDYGIQVVAEGGNGQEAIQLAASTDVDVVLMDLRMPIMDGLAAARAEPPRTLAGSTPHGTSPRWRLGAAAAASLRQGPPLAMDLPWSALVAGQRLLSRSRGAWR